MKKIVIATCLASFCFGSASQQELVISLPAVASAASADSAGGSAASSSSPAIMRIAVSVAAGPSELPADRVSFYHNVAGAKELYQAGKQNAIGMLAGYMESWKANPKELTKKVFWAFLKVLGRKRQEIATDCASEDAKDFGALRGDNIINTPVKNYPILEQFMLALGQNSSLLRSFPDDVLQRVKGTQALLGGQPMSTSSAMKTIVDSGVEDESVCDNFFFNIMIRDVNRARSQAIAQKFFRHQEGALSHAFYACIVPSVGRIALFGNLFTCGSAEENSPAIAELHALFQRFVTTNDPAVLFAFFQKFAVTMPYHRGASAVNEWILEAGCKFLKVPVPQQRQFAEFDQMAQISEQDVFVRFMMARHQGT